MKNLLPQNRAGTTALSVVSAQPYSREDLPHAVSHRSVPQVRLRRGASPPAEQTGRRAAGNLAITRPAFSELPKMQPKSKAEAKRYKGPVKRAALLSALALQWVDEAIQRKSGSPESDRLKVRLSVRNGLRAGEIAALPISAMLNANGRIDADIEIYSSKTRKKRRIAMHPEVRDALEALLSRYPHATHAAFSIGRGGILRRQSASCVANFFKRRYREAGLIGCSSHSGRRTFATEFARLLGRYDASILDLQQALGHARLSSTQCYIDPCSDRARELIRSLGK